MGLVKCVRHAGKKKKKRNGGKKKNHQTCQHAVPALNLFPISSNLWEPGLWSLILFSSVPPTTAPSSVSHFQFHLLPPLCDFHLISLLKFKIYSRFFFFSVGFTLVLRSPCLCSRFGIANQQRVYEEAQVRNSLASPFMDLPV